jgi:flagellin
MTPPCRTGASPVCPQKQFNLQRDIKNGFKSAHQLVCNDCAADPPQCQLAARDHAEPDLDRPARGHCFRQRRLLVDRDVDDSLGLSAATVDTEYTALTAVVGDKTGGLTKLQALLVEAKTAGIDRTKIQADITQIQQQMKGTANAATFNGVNWLSTTATTPATFNLVSSFSRVGGTPTIGSITLTIANYSLYTATQGGILDKVSGAASIDTISIAALTDSTADMTTLDGYIAQVTAGINSVASAAADLGAVKNRISTNTEFVKTLMDSVDRGVGQLVDADMNAESTRLQALQTQQQLGVQALSIANQNSQSILSLFRG